MAVLTDDQLSQIAFQNAMADANHAKNLELASYNARLEAVRIAKDTLFENRRSLPVGEREITADDITTFADTLTDYINK